MSEELLKGDESKLRITLKHQEESADDV